MPSSVHIDANRGWGGGQEQSFGLALALAARGEEVRFIAQTGGALAERLKGTYLSWEAIALRGVEGVSAAFGLRRRFVEWEPEMVHIHDSASVAAGALGARMAGGIPVLVTRRTQRPIRGGWLGRLKYAWCDRIICVSEAVRRQCLEGGVPEERLVVISDFVDCSYFRPGAVDEQAEERRPTIGVVGRLSKEKGHAVLLGAMKVVAEKIENARLLICGEGPKVEELRKQAEASGIGDHVEFLGFAPDVRRVLSAADVFVMPSLSEGLGVAALEAMAMGKPVVASDAGGLRESVVDGETGVIVPAGEVEPLGEALVKLLRDPALAREMGEAGRERAVEHFDRPRIVERILGLYDEVLRDRGR